MTVQNFKSRDPRLWMHGVEEETPAEGPSHSLEPSAIEFLALPKNCGSSPAAKEEDISEIYEREVTSGMSQRIEAMFKFF